MWPKFCDFQYPENQFRGVVCTGTATRLVGLPFSEDHCPPFRELTRFGHLSLPMQALYPDTGGVAPVLARPVILLIVRKSRRGLGNNDDVRMEIRSRCELRYHLQEVERIAASTYAETKLARSGNEVHTDFEGLVDVQ